MKCFMETLESVLHIFFLYLKSNILEGKKKGGGDVGRAGVIDLVVGSIAPLPFQGICPTFR